MISIKSKIHGNKVDAEIDEYGELSSFAAGGIGWEARVHKNKTEKETVSAQGTVPCVWMMINL